MLIRPIENLVSQDKDHIADLSLLDTINQDLKAAMLSKDVIVRDTLRMLIADIKRFEIDERVEADDTKVSDLINKNVKQRRDSIAQFKSAGREDLVATEEEQLNVILKYLPQQLSEEEIQKMVKDAEANKEADKKKRESVDVRNQADTLIHSTEKNLKEHGTKVSDAEKKAIEDASTAVKEALKGEDTEDIKKKTEALVQASMKLGEAIYKSQQSTKPDSGKDDDGDDAGKKDENVVDADFEEVKDENKEKSA